MNNTCVTPMVQSFLNSDFDNLILKPGFNFDFNNLYYNNEPIITRLKSNLFIQCNTSLLIVVSVLNSVPGLKAYTKDNNIIINGLLWDGLKSNINLFI